MIRTNWLQLNESMDYNHPIKTMLRRIKKVQMFLLANSEEGQEFTEIQLVTNIVTKLLKKGVMYAKLLEKRQQRDARARSN